MSLDLIYNSQSGVAIRIPKIRYELSIRDRVRATFRPCHPYLSVTFYHSTSDTHLDLKGFLAVLNCLAFAVRAASAHGDHFTDTQDLKHLRHSSPMWSCPRQSNPRAPNDQNTGRMRWGRRGGSGHVAASGFCAPLPFGPIRPIRADVDGSLERTAGQGRVFPALFVFSKRHDQQSTSPAGHLPRAGQHRP